MLLSDACTVLHYVVMLVYACGHVSKCGLCIYACIPAYMLFLVYLSGCIFVKENVYIRYVYCISGYLCVYSCVHAWV